ncbi:hypothetical protein [Sphingomonas profundi]|uniref:hypothetical protein n=1 Tax=Alterirhizorhabdus profundi TaxID=2681549 RepID=UPI0012E7DF8E|nr:hypothetical protein [Sphingomonas profundi]
MTGSTIFDRVDPEGLAIATNAFGLAFIGANLRVSPAIVASDSVSPAALIVGLCKAHAAGLASAIVAASRLDPADAVLVAAFEEAVIADCTAYIRAELANARLEEGRR